MSEFISRARYNTVVTTPVATSMRDKIKEKADEGGFPSNSEWQRRAFALALKKPLKYRNQSDDY